MQTVIDLCAGAGGFSLAAKQAGMEVSLAVEIDRLTERHSCTYCTWSQDYKVR